MYTRKSRLRGKLIDLSLAETIARAAASRQKGSSLAELQAMVADVAWAYLENEPPKSMRLHFEDGPVLANE